MNEYIEDAASARSYKESINYPFKSKYKYIKDTSIKTEPYIPDYQLKTVKKQRNRFIKLQNIN